MEKSKLMRAVQLLTLITTSALQSRDAPANFVLQSDSSRKRRMAREVEKLSTRPNQAIDADGQDDMTTAVLLHTSVGAVPSPACAAARRRWRRHEIKRLGWHRKTKPEGCLAG